MCGHHGNAQENGMGSGSGGKQTPVKQLRHNLYQGRGWHRRGARCCRRGATFVVGDLDTIAVVYKCDVCGATHAVG